MKAHEWLLDSANTLQKRATDYDKPKGERSVPAAVIAFNAIVGACECGRERIDNRHGWLFMHLLKKVRLWTNPNTFHRDSALDGIAYDSLEAEEWDEKFAKELLEMRELSNAPKPQRHIGHDAGGASEDESEHTGDFRLG